MFKNKTNKYLRRAGYTYIKLCRPLDKPMASLSNCHPDLLPWLAILLNLVKHNVLSEPFDIYELTERFF